LVAVFSKVSAKPLCPLMKMRAVRAVTHVGLDPQSCIQKLQNAGL
jgi:hypothetical protein